MEPEGSLPQSQVPSASPYPDPARSRPHPPHPTFWGYILILSSHLPLVLSVHDIAPLNSVCPPTVKHFCLSESVLNSVCFRIPTIRRKSLPIFERQDWVSAVTICIWALPRSNLGREACRFDCVEFDFLCRRFHWWNLKRSWEINAEMDRKLIMLAWEDINWIHLVQDDFHWLLGVNTVIVFRVSQNAGNFWIVIRLGSSVGTLTWPRGGRSRNRGLGQEIRVFSTASRSAVGAFPILVSTGCLWHLPRS